MEDHYNENNSNKKDKEYEQIFATQLDEIRLGQFCSNHFITFSTVSTFSAYEHSSHLCTKFTKDTSKRVRDFARCCRELFVYRNPVLDSPLRNISISTIKEREFLLNRNMRHCHCVVREGRELQPVLRGKLARWGAPVLALTAAPSSTLTTGFSRL